MLVILAASKPFIYCNNVNSNPTIYRYPEINEIENNCFSTIQIRTRKREYERLLKLTWASEASNPNRKRTVQLIHLWGGYLSWNRLHNREDLSVLNFIHNLQRVGILIWNSKLELNRGPSQTTQIDELPQEVKSSMKCVLLHFTEKDKLVKKKWIII